MRNSMMFPGFPIILFSTLLFLVTVPEGTLGRNRLTTVKRAVSLLTPFVTTYLDDLRSHRDSEKVKIRVWMHNGDPQLNGCGLFFVGTGHSGGSRSDYFPQFAEHRCGHETWRMRMTSQGVKYDRSLHLGSERAKDVEMHADGWYNTFINIVCFGFTERTIDNGPRAFCTNNLLLKGCKSLLNKWNDVDIDWDDMLMTRTTRGIHKLIFRDVDRVVHAFERLERNPDDTDAIYTICDKMGLERGNDGANSWDCPADRVNRDSNNVEDFDARNNNITDLDASRNNMTDLNARNGENKDPYGCKRYNWGN